MQQTMLHGDVVIVTGAAGGIGRGIVQRLASMSVRVAVVDVDDKAAADAAAQIRRQGFDADAFCVDVSNPESVEQGFRAIRESMGPVFGLVNNAGIFPRSLIVEMEYEEWNRVLSVNLTGAFLCSRAVAPSMIEAGRGSIVNISSTTALRATPRGAHYAASKAGLMSLTKTLAHELSKHGVRANCILAGIVDTSLPRIELSSDELSAIAKQIPLGRIGQPEDIASVVAFLMGEDARYITGQSIAVNGGAMMFP